MTASDIVIKGAREHNLRNIDLILPRHQLICLTGVSGSGKSSLAFDTLYAEGQRRYVESLSSFARQFLGQMPKPDLDHISGLSPSISISQKSSGTNPRSTVGTITEIYDYLRVLYARVGQAFCPRCGGPITAQSREQILQQILQFPAKTRFSIAAPLIRGQKGEYRDLFQDLLKQGFARARINGEIASLSNPPSLDRQMRHNIDVVIDRLVIQPSVRPRLAEAVELAMKLGKGTLVAIVERGDSSDANTAEHRDVIFSSDYACGPCGLSFEPPSPQLFSFNSYQGMCRTCDGLGDLYSFDPERLIPNPSLSMKQGCMELVGPWKELGRWKRHIFKGVADTMERVLELDPGTLLETPWERLPEHLRGIWLHGTGDQHITYTWRSGSTPSMYGGKFEGIIAELLAKHRNSKSRIHRARLEKYMSTMRCPDCQGARLLPQARSVRLTTAHSQFADRPARGLPEVCQLAIRDAQAFFSDLVLDDTQRKIATEVLKEIRGRLGFLLNVGLDYLTLDRTAPTLSGGESQRIRLAGQIGSGLVGVLYILDEPSIGLHPRDNEQLLATLQRLRDMGNTVVVVEHDEETIRAADHVIDFGPGPGVRGGEVVAAGTVEQVMKSRKSVTGQFLGHRRQIPIPATRRPGNGQVLKILGAAHNNLQDVDVTLPLGSFLCVTGVSGSGKSSLIGDILVEALRRDLNGGLGAPGRHRAIEGLEHLDKLIAIDQSPIGRTPRSNPATYIKVFDDIRQLFAKLPEAKRRGYKPGRFSFNVRGGRCEACEGNGSNRLEMDFLADVWVTCPVCQGRRFSRETLQVHFKDRSITDVLDMDIQQALELFENIPDIRRKLQTLHDVGLDYLKIGQPSPTLSGGEAQRIKLARELVKKSTGKTLYLLDEPTTGLHFADIEMLLKVLHDFVDAGNTVLVVEHNLDVIKTADWVIDLGPEGGEQGGRIVATGTPEDVAKCDESHTGRALRKLLREVKSRNAKGGRTPTRPKPRRRVGARMDTIRVRGAAQHNLRNVNAEVVRDQMTVLCGPSGSGKSSLAMDTIYAEGQRRYVESLSAYARQFVSQMQKPQLEHIEGLSPAIAIEQKNLGHTPRSTVGTVTEIYDYLRILLARLGQPYCPDCALPVGTQTPDEITDKLLANPEGTRLVLLAPMDAEHVQSFETMWQELRAEGYVRVRLDGTTHALEEIPPVDRRRKHEVEVVIDRLTIRPKERSRIAESVAAALSLGDGVLRVAYPSEGIPEPEWETVTHSQHRACQQCGRSFDLLSPHHFSFNSALGWCPACQGLGTQVGANPAALLRDKKLSLREGALLLWPDLNHAYSQAMLAALSNGTGLAIDIPYEQLNARQRRILLHGTGDRWFDVFVSNESRAEEARSSAAVRPTFRFQFKGLYPTLEQAARLSARLRTSLERFVDEVDCSACGGSRLRDDAGAVQFHGFSIDDLCRLPLGQLDDHIRSWKLDPRERKVAGELLDEVKNRLRFLLDVGLEYLTLARTAASLSNGESQRIRLGSQLGSGLCGVLYVLDEPTIGLHPRDNRRLITALHKLRDLGNTLLVVEHDREVIAESDQVLDFGPGSGRLGGEIVARGTPAQLPRKRDSVTGPYLNGRKVLPIPRNRRLEIADEALLGRQPVIPCAAVKRGENGQSADWLEILGARHHNLRRVNVAIPLAAMTAITGPSGSGKSSLMNDVLYAFLARQLHRAATVPGACDEIRGYRRINKVILVDQQPLGNTPTSNPATYSGVFDLIRQLFAQLPESKLRGYTIRRFSFNVPGGRCEACEGNGQKRIEMHFLPDVWVECETCRGRRYNPETLGIQYHGKSISDVLDLTCAEAAELFREIPKIRRILRTLCDVGLDYLTLGQPAPTLSGGEAQRVKLAAELGRPDTGQTLYLLDEPTTGLHFDDLRKLLDVLHRLTDLGNTVVLIEHNLDVVKACDWMIDMGPEAGDGGGLVVAAGTPEHVVAWANRSAAAGKGDAATLPSHTGMAMSETLREEDYRERARFDPETWDVPTEQDRDIEEVGGSVASPWVSNGMKWHLQDRVGRQGEPCRWDARILATIVDRIQSMGEFGATRWDSRSVVEVPGRFVSRGWFLHAITGETWLLKLKFRTGPGTFDERRLMQELKLKTLNEIPEIPRYGNEPRVKCADAPQGFQEIQISAHDWREIDTPPFWKFLREAAESFLVMTERQAFDGKDRFPWRSLGRTWHMTTSVGFQPGRWAIWDSSLIDRMTEILLELVPTGTFHWNFLQTVEFRVPGEEEPWIILHTKHSAGLVVDLLIPHDLSCPSPPRDLIDESARLRGASFDRHRMLVRHLGHGIDRELRRYLGDFFRQRTESSVATQSS